MTTTQALLPTFLALVASLTAQLDGRSERGRVDAGNGGARLELASVSVPLPNGKTATAERGMLRVPIVRADPASKEIGIDVWRFRALEGAPQGAPPIFQLHGGPGWPGLEPAGIDWEGDIVPFLRTADLVIVGQRGIGSSTDTSCGPLLAEGARPGLDASREERAQYLRQKCGECRAHWEAQGYDLRGLNVKPDPHTAAVVARDQRGLPDQGPEARQARVVLLHEVDLLHETHRGEIARVVALQETVFPGQVDVVAQTREEQPARRQAVPDRSDRDLALGEG